MTSVVQSEAFADLDRSVMLEFLQEAAGSGAFKT
jgi:hypothetical protein